MSVKVMARVWALSTRGDGELLVMLALADFANDQGECWPSVPVLAQKARLTERQTRRVLDKLEEAGEIRRIRSTGGRNKRNRYFITLPENPDKITLKELQGKNNSEFYDRKTLTPVSGALNHHRTFKSEHAKDKPSPATSTDPRIREFFDWWAKEYLSRFSASYVFTGGKEGALVKRLLRTHDLPQLQILALRFFESTDTWVREHGGYTVGVYASQINKLVSIAKSAPRPPKEMPA